MRKKTVFDAGQCLSICLSRSCIQLSNKYYPESQKNNGSNIINNNDNDNDNKLLLQQENIHRHEVPGSQLEEAGAQSLAVCRPASVRVNQHVPLLYSRQVTT